MTDPRTEMSIPGVAPIRLRRIKAGSLFKLIFLATAAVFVPLMTFFGILAFLGMEVVMVSGEHVTGVMGLVWALLIAPVFSLLFSVFAWVWAYIGLRIWGHFRPITLAYVPADE